MYKDTEIEGRWRIVYDGVEDQTEEVAVIERIAHRIEGMITVVKGPDSGRTYVLSGEFKNSLLTANYSAADRLALDRGAFVLQLTNNGYGFRGQSSYYHDSHSIVSRECVWDRIK